MKHRSKLKEFLIEDGVTARAVYLNGVKIGWVDWCGYYSDLFDDFIQKNWSDERGYLINKPFKESANLLEERILIKLESELDSTQDALNRLKELQKCLAK